MTENNININLFVIHYNDNTTEMYDSLNSALYNCFNYNRTPVQVTHNQLYKQHAYANQFHNEIVAIYNLNTLNIQRTITLCNNAIKGYERIFNDWDEWAQKCLECQKRAVEMIMQELQVQVKA